MKNKYLVFTISFFLIGITHAQDSLNMQKLANVDGLGSPYNDVWGYTDNENEYAILGSRTAINIIDVTDCSNPIVLNSWTDGGNKTWRDFKDYGDYIYGVCDSCDEGLQTINKNTFANFQSFDEFNSAHNIFIDKSSGRLYVAGTNTLNRGLYVYDLNTNPSDPTLLAAIDFQDWDGIASGVNWYVHDVYVKNDTAYCSHGWRGHAVWDMTDLTDVVKIGERLTDPGYNHSSWIHETLPYEYVAREVPNGLPLQVYDNSDWTDIEIAGTFAHSIHETGINSAKSTPHNPFVHEGNLYVSNYHDGIKVYSLNDPTAPQLIAYYDTYNTNNGNYSGYQGNWGAYPFLPSGCILASDRSTGLYTLKITDKLTHELIIEDADIYLNQNDSKVIFYSSDNQQWGFSANFSGNLESIASTPSTFPQSENLVVRISKPGGRIYFRSGNGKLIYFTMLNSGELSGPLSLLPGDVLDQSFLIDDQYLKLSTFASEMKMVSPDGSCFSLTTNTSGQLNIESISCD